VYWSSARENFWRRKFHALWSPCTQRVFLVGCAALYPLGSTGSGEIACVATHPDFLSQGTASRLLVAIENQAHSQSIGRLFVLTTQAAHWFQEQGFIETAVDALPKDKKLLYNYQRNSRVLCKVL
jgi:amino-acid N-acetyltransferase